MTKTNKNTTTNELDASDLLDTLRITKVDPRDVGGTWVTGAIGEHRFDALVFEDHAETPAYEHEDSRISKLSLIRLADWKLVVSFDRGWDVKPTTPIAKQIVDLLAAGLAETIFSK